MAWYIVSYRISRYWGRIVAYLYRDNYPSNEVDMPHNSAIRPWFILAHVDCVIHRATAWLMLQIIIWSVTTSCDTDRRPPLLPAAAADACLGRCACMRAGREAVRWSAALRRVCGMFESLPGSFLAATHSAVRTPDTCGGQILNWMRGVGLWQNF